MKHHDTLNAHMPRGHQLTKPDVNGVNRYWWAEQDGGRYRTFSQYTRTGKKRRSGWVTPRPNKSRTRIEQATFEINALYRKKMHEGWQRTNKMRNTPPAPRERHYLPMLAHKYPQRKVKFPARVQPKLDGVRCIATSTGLWTRKRHAITSVPHIWREVNLWLEAHPEVYALDGELYLHGWALPKISGLARQKNPTTASFKLEFHVFDCISNYSSSTMPFDTRRLYLSRIESKTIKLVRTELAEDVEDLDHLHRLFVKQGYEGSMIRDPESPYVERRTTALLKRKDFEDEEATIVSIQEGNGDWTGVAKKLVLRDRHGVTFGSGVRGTMDDLREVYRTRKNYLGKRCTFRFLYRDRNSGVPQLPVVVNLDRGPT